MGCVLLLGTSAAVGSGGLLVLLAFDGGFAIAGGGCQDGFGGLDVGFIDLDHNAAGGPQIGGSDFGGLLVGDHRLDAVALQNRSNKLSFGDLGNGGDGFHTEKLLKHGQNSQSRDHLAERHHDFVIGFDGFRLATQPNRCHHCLLHVLTD